MRMILTILLTSLVIIFLMFLLNSASYNGASKMKKDSALESSPSPKENLENDKK